MDIDGYFRSINSEFIGLRDRVRHLIGDAHWPTDGGWKESVIRTALRRALGSSLEIGYGFFVNGNALSRQCDVLVWQSESPLLFRDGNLAVVPAQAVRAVIEVKTTLDRATLDDGLANLKASASVLPDRDGVLLGLFAYETTYASSTVVLDTLRADMSDRQCVVDLVCHGPQLFVRYWHSSPRFRGDIYECWHSYKLPDVAFAYFIANVVSALSPDTYAFEGEPFFPPDGKERYKDDRRRRTGAVVEQNERFWGPLDEGVDS